jgi:hypothetical protein
MYRVIAAFIAAIAALSYLLVELSRKTPVAVGTAVIAEKPLDGKLGGQAAVVLPANLSVKQHRLLNMAYDLAQQHGFKNPELAQAVLLQETKAGGMRSYRVANAGPEAYFGPMQVKLAAAKDVLKRWPSLFDEYDFHTRSDDEIKANLILNDKFNLEVGVKYLVILKTTYGLQGRVLINAYNRGPGGVKHVDHDTFHYAIGAERKLANLKMQR